MILSLDGEDALPHRGHEDLRRQRLGREGLIGKASVQRMPIGHALACGDGENFVLGTALEREVLPRGRLFAQTRSVYTQSN